MQYQKDGLIYSELQVRQRHPNVSFAPTTYAELGYAEYTPPAPEPVVIVPQVVSRFQGEAVMLLDGVLLDVENHVAQGSALMQLAWKRAQEFRRTSPMVLEIAAALGWTEAYLDSLFIRASSIEA